jgi:hypothetical protein
MHGNSMKIKDIIYLSLLCDALLISLSGNEYSQPGVPSFGANYAVDPCICALDEIVDSILSNSVATLLNSSKSALIGLPHLLSFRHGQDLNLKSTT